MIRIKQVIKILTIDIKQVMIGTKIYRERNDRLNVGKECKREKKEKRGNVKGKILITKI